jgi:hypothetical protein
MTHDEWSQIALAYHRWATDAVVVRRKTRISDESAKQVLGSILRLLKYQAREMRLPPNMLAPLSVTEDIDTVSNWVRGQSTTRGYLSKQVCLRVLHA